MTHRNLLVIGCAAWLAATSAWAQDGPARRRDMRDRDKPREQRSERRDFREGREATVRAMAPNAGNEGATVTIEGVGLAKTTDVKIGRQTAKPTSVSPRRVTFTIPARVRPGPRPVVLVIDGKDVDAGTFTVAGREAEPPPATAPGPDPRDRDRRRRDDRRDRDRDVHPVTISSMTPMAGPAGTSVTIRGRGFPDGVEVLVDGTAVRTSVDKRRLLTFAMPKARGKATVALRVPGADQPLFVGRFDIDKPAPPPNARKQWREERRKRAEEAWQERRKAIIAQKIEDRRRAEEERRAELERTRAERIRQRREELRAKWQAAFLADADVRAEMSLHAERSARLDRMKRLAEIEDLGKLVVRIQVLIDREDERHDNRMSLLKENFTL